MPTTITASMPGFSDLRDYLDGLPVKLYVSAKDQYREAAMRVHKTVSDRVRKGGGNTLHSRTGQLRRSLRWKVYGETLTGLGSHVFSDGNIAPYNVMQELGSQALLGGPVKAKKAYARLPGGPYLNIPSRANRTPAGVQRLSARDVFSQGGFIVKLKGPAGKYIVMLNGKVMFSLVKSVTIPPRLGMIKAGLDEVPSLIVSIERAVDEAIR